MPFSHDPLRTQARRLAIFRLRVALIILAIAAAAIWPFIIPIASTREINLALTPANPELRWSLEYLDARLGRPNGLWLSLSGAPANETLEIIPSGKLSDQLTPSSSDSTKPPTGIVFLYRIRPLAAHQADVDFKPLAARAGSSPDISNGWRDFTSGPGLVYTADTPGLLRLQAPPGGVELTLAKTPKSGPITIRYADSERTLDLYSTKDERTTITLTRQLPLPDARSVIRDRLPNYPLSNLELRWHPPLGFKAAPASDERTATLHNPRTTLRVFGIPVSEQLLTPRTSSESPASDTPFSVSFAGGSLPLGHSPGIPFLGHIWGWLVTFISLTTLAAFATALLSISFRAPPRWLTAERAALGAVIISRLWISTWAPTLYCNDSIDYMRAALRISESGSTGDPGPWRLYGPSYLFAFLWRISPDNFNALLGITQGLLGILTAFLAGRIARRFMPQPWPALATALVGLSPVLLMWSASP